jgi:hypothetical protein
MAGTRGGPATVGTREKIMHRESSRPRLQRGTGTGRLGRLLTAAVVLLSSALTSVALGGGDAVNAGPRIPSMPKVNPVDFTPRVVDDSVVTDAGVRKLQQVGYTMYAGGHFHSVRNAPRTHTYTRHNIFSFDVRTGWISHWAPYTNGQVFAIERSADGRYLYIGGDFWTFDGVRVNQLVKYDRYTNRVDTRFKFSPSATGRVSDLRLVGRRLFVAGNFPGGIVAVNPTTGAKTSYFAKVAAAGSEPQFSTRIYRFAVNPKATRAVVIGSFTSIGGHPRQQAAMLELGADSASVSPWYSTEWNKDCRSDLRWYTRDVDWSPSGGDFVIVTTGGGASGTAKLCDTVTRWIYVDKGDQEPYWRNYSGGDTFHSVAVTNRGVYVSGHFRWLDNPLGHNSKGPGAVDRLGIGALSWVTGKALSWNPGKSVEGGQGGYDLYFTGRGLWVGQFEKYLGRNNAGTGLELHEGLGLLPY